MHIKWVWEPNPKLANITGVEWRNPNPYRILKKQITNLHMWLDGNTQFLGWAINIPVATRYCIRVKASGKRNPSELVSIVNTMNMDILQDVSSEGSEDLDLRFTMMNDLVKGTVEMVHAKLDSPMPEVLFGLD